MFFVFNYKILVGSPPEHRARFNGLNKLNHFIICPVFAPVAKARMTAHMK